MIPGGQQPLITVVIPAYNRCASIGIAIESVRQQTYPNWEVVVVDDGSKDGTPEIVERLSATDLRIRLIQHETNRGAQAARNTGFRAAAGQWVVFLDSDDQLLPDCLLLRLQAALEQDSWVVDSAGYWRQDDGPAQPYEKFMPGPGWVYSQLLTRQGPMFQSLLIAKKALERIGGLDEKIIRCQEWDTAIRLAKHYRFAVVDKPTFVWDCRGADTMTKNLRTAGIGYQQIMHKHFWGILRHGGPRLMAAHYRFVSACFLRAGQKVAMWRCRLLFALWWFLDPRNYVKKIRELFHGREIRARKSV